MSLGNLLRLLLVSSAVIVLTVYAKALAASPQTDVTTVSHHIQPIP